MGVRHRCSSVLFVGCCLLSLLLAASAQDATKQMPPSAVEDLEDWVADGNVVSPNRKTRETTDNCWFLREQLSARENQVNELLKEKKDTQGHSKEKEELRASLKTAQQRLSTAEAQLQSLKASSSDSSDATAAQAAQAAAELAGMKQRLQEADTKLQTQQSECSSSEKALTDAQTRVEALTSDLQVAMDAHKKLQASSDLSSKADRKALKDAQSALGRAQTDADKATSALTLAQGEALTMLQSFDDWFGAKLPSWAAEKFGLASEAASPTVQSVSERLQPYWDSAKSRLEPHTSEAYARGSQYGNEVYKRGSEYGKAGWDASSKAASQAYKTSGEYASKAYSQGSMYGQSAYTYGRKTGAEAWLAAHPHLQKAYITLQAWLQQAWKAVSSTLGPYTSVAGSYLERGFREVRRHTHGLTSHPTLVQLRRNAVSAWSEMEPAVATAMRSVEVLRPYARKPYTTLVLYGGMSVPLVLFLIPAMLAIGASNELPQLPEQSGDSGMPQGVVTPGLSGPASQSSNARRKGKAKQQGTFSDGGETVAYSTSK